MRKYITDELFELHDSDINRKVDQFIFNCLEELSREYDDTNIIGLFRNTTLESFHRQLTFNGMRYIIFALLPANEKKKQFIEGLKREHKA